MHTNPSAGGAALALTVTLVVTGAGVALAQDERILTVEQTSIQAVQAPGGTPMSESVAGGRVGGSPGQHVRA